LVLSLLAVPSVDDDPTATIVSGCGVRAGPESNAAARTLWQVDSVSSLAVAPEIEPRASRDAPKSATIPADRSGFPAVNLGIQTFRNCSGMIPARS
jgi:hypothetical protein